MNPTKFDEYHKYPWRVPTPPDRQFVANVQELLAIADAGARELVEGITHEVTAQEDPLRWMAALPRRQRGGRYLPDETAIREIAVLDLMSHGFSQTQITILMGYASDQSVHKIVKKLKGNLRCKTDVELIATALRWGIIC